MSLKAAMLFILMFLMLFKLMAVSIVTNIYNLCKLQVNIRVSEVFGFFCLFVFVTFVMIFPVWWYAGTFPQQWIYEWLQQFRELQS